MKGFVGVVRGCQPGAVSFGDAEPDVRWVSNENGMAGQTNWSLLRRDEFYPSSPRYAELTEGQIDGAHGLLAESEVFIRSGWFCHPGDDSQVKSVTYWALGDGELDGTLAVDLGVEGSTIGD